jgi:hypothetical protein
MLGECFSLHIKIPILSRKNRETRMGQPALLAAK